MSELGSLSQTVRQNQLKGARVTFFVIGVLTILLNGFLLARAEKEVEELLQKEIAALGPGMEVDQAALQDVRKQAVNATRLIYGSTIALGAAFVLLGVLVYSWPVPIVITGLVLYVASIGIFAMLEPASLLQGIIVKIIIIASLVKSVQAAFAYERERGAGSGGALNTF